ncbi:MULTISPECIES: PaaI family thioesterase [unclassified Sporosarcina]|uniref:PaaI family thioesterase n=1 Tax=unclassified Sporosarcina TaxID=2647733 RepID=UPI000C16A853|nr:MULTISPECIES: PaaI family thioesterase [unclassified Sporosarcina]PID00856.1 thioesterase [Sporosarcina sp. P29]PID07085.1 thioesterase [Sporosarcina sp. P30]PID10281.1 thioesterase [Sporosarcina sp. P31]PID12179.1 thioesterase [Sporosarcina sp. P32b]
MKEYVTHAIQDSYADDFSWCYGCGRLNEEGNHFRTGWEGEQTVTYSLPPEKYTAIPGFVYGGFLASFMDCHGTGSCALALHRKNGHEPGDGSVPPRFVTASLQITYNKPTPQGKVLKAIGNVTEIHPKKWKVAVEIYAEDELCVSGEVVGVVMPATFTK